MATRVTRMRNARLEQDDQGWEDSASLSNEPHFDEELQAWILSRYKDVAAALREPKLVPAAARGPAIASPAELSNGTSYRAVALEAVSPGRIRQWEAHFVPEADRLARLLSMSQSTDLVAEYAHPWCIAVAGIMTGIPAQRCAGLAQAAQSIFYASCEPYDQQRDEPAQNATKELAAAFRGTPLLNMQMFIALTTSLPAFLGVAWLTLLCHPAHLRAVQCEPALIPGAIDELLRVAGANRVQFRRAIQPVSIAGCTIQAGQQLLLRLDRANLDPERFPQPTELQFNGRSVGHLAFGAGAHSCVAGSLIRSAATAVTEVLVRSFEFETEYSATLVECFAMRFVASLRVTLRPLR